MSTDHAINWAETPAAVWRRHRQGLRAIRRLDPVGWADLTGIERQQAALARNTERFLAGEPSNNTLLWGARGTGKSSLIKALLNRYREQGLRMIEVDKDGKEVWRVTNDDLPNKPINDACGVQRLPNGNTVITSYHAKGQAVKLVEVTRAKEVVWRYQGQPAGFHHFQILTTNGKPVKDNTWK